MWGGGQEEENKAPMKNMDKHVDNLNSLKIKNESQPQWNYLVLREMVYSGLGIIKYVLRIENLWKCKIQNKIK